MLCGELLFGGLNRREKPETMKKAPKIGALEWKLVANPLRGGTPGYFFFLAFGFAAVFFLVFALFID
jgi:hypothetical protein